MRVGWPGYVYPALPPCSLVLAAPGRPMEITFFPGGLEEAHRNQSPLRGDLNPQSGTLGLGSRGDGSSLVIQKFFASPRGNSHCPGAGAQGAPGRSPCLSVSVSPWGLDTGLGCEPVDEQ